MTFFFNKDNYICSGELLFNLEEIRKDDLVNKMYKYMITKNKNLYHPEKTIINIVCYPIDILHAKYGVFNYYKLNILLKNADKTYKNKKYKYSHKELRNAYFNPSILHCIMKPWKIKKNIEPKYCSNIYKKIRIL